MEPRILDIYLKSGACITLRLKSFKTESSANVLQSLTWESLPEEDRPLYFCIQDISAVVQRRAP